jgi:hypothetical protein
MRRVYKNRHRKAIKEEKKRKGSGKRKRTRRR